MRFRSPIPVSLHRKLLPAAACIAVIAGTLAPFLLVTATSTDPVSISFRGQTIQVPQYLAGRFIAQNAVDVLEQNGMAAIVGDLQQEILAGSSNTILTAGTASTTLSFPVAPATVTPALSGPLSGTAPGFGNLLKYSANGQPFYAGVNYIFGSPASNRASGASTGNPSQNGSPVTSARWNLPLLLQKQNPAQSTDLTPVVPTFSPDWILVTGSNSNYPGATTVSASMKASGANPVVGRYAYTIYDEGGL